MEVLTKALKRLLYSQPFYGMFMLNLQKIIVDDTHPVKTAGVGLNGLNLILYVNKNFFHSLTEKQQEAILKHEAMHICFFHLTSAFKASNHHNMNIAEDCEINQKINDLPEGCVTLERLETTLNTKLKPNAGAWYYYEEIQKFAKEHPELCNGNGDLDEDTIDDHSMWEGNEISEAEKKLIENQIGNRMKDVTDQVKKQAGSIPGELSEILKRLQNKPPVFNWRQYFRRLVGNSITSDILLTRMKPSKRFPDARGIRFKKKPTILVGVDTSGSINTKDLADFFSEIHHIWKTGVKVTVVECDTKIREIFDYTGKQEIKVSGRGGTVLEPVIDYYKKHSEYSVCILFTDGYCEPKMPLCNNLIWVITSNGNKSQQFTPGKTILIP